MTRELLLAQASDWPFLINRGTAPEYADARLRDHLAAFHRLAARTFEESPEKIAFLEMREQSSRIFPNIEWNRFLAY
jgi:1,4-alpha-glucan branching enzyme